MESNFKTYIGEILDVNQIILQLSESPNRNWKLISLGDRTCSFRLKQNDYSFFVIRDWGHNLEYIDFRIVDPRGNTIIKQRQDISEESLLRVLYFDICKKYVVKYKNEIKEALEK